MPMRISFEQTNQKGFTLLELMIVIGIIAVLVAFAFPCYGLLHKHYSLYSAAQELAANLRCAQQMAVDQGAVYSICVSKNGYTIKKEGGKTVKNKNFPAGIKAAGSCSFKFYPTAEPNAGQTIMLQSYDGEKCYVEVASVTGKVTVK